MSKVIDLYIQLGGMDITSYRRNMRDFADECKYYERIVTNSNVRSCLNCEFIDKHIFICKKLDKTVLEYAWD